MDGLGPGGTGAEQLGGGGVGPKPFRANRANTKKVGDDENLG